MSFFKHFCLCRERSRNYELTEVFLSDRYLKIELISSVLESLNHLKLEGDVFVLYSHTQLQCIITTLITSVPDDGYGDGLRMMISSS